MNPAKQIVFNMFKFKKNLSQIFESTNVSPAKRSYSILDFNDSPSKKVATNQKTLSSASLSTYASPVPKQETIFEPLITTALVQPQPRFLANVQPQVRKPIKHKATYDFIDKFESKIDQTKRENEKLKADITKLNESLDNLCERISRPNRQSVNQTTIYKVMISDCQLEVRTLLNEIYHPGRERAQKLSELIEKCHKSHSNKYERLSHEFEMIIETVAEAVKNKRDSLLHEIDMHRRTLLSFEETKADEEAKPVEDEICPEDNKLVEEDKPSNDEGMESDSTSIDECTEVTAIDETRDDGSFTQCQAQRAE